MISSDVYEIDSYDTFDTMMWLSPRMPHGHRVLLPSVGPEHHARSLMPSKR